MDIFAMMEYWGGGALWFAQHTCFDTDCIKKRKENKQFLFGFSLPAHLLSGLRFNALKLVGRPSYTLSSATHSGPWCFNRAATKQKILCIETKKWINTCCLFFCKHSKSMKSNEKKKRNCLKRHNRHTHLPCCECAVPSNGFNAALVAVHGRTAYKVVGWGERKLQYMETKALLTSNPRVWNLYYSFMKTHLCQHYQAKNVSEWHCICANYL